MFNNGIVRALYIIFSIVHSQNYLSRFFTPHMSLHFQFSVVLSLEIFFPPHRPFSYLVSVDECLRIFMVVRTNLQAFSRPVWQISEKLEGIRRM